MIILLLLLLFFSGAAPAQTEPASEPAIARAGNVFISEREFLERFELTPGLYRHRKPQLEQEKLTLLYSIVAEKLLAQEALARNLDTAALYNFALADITRLLVRDELYRQEVRAKVTVSAAEIKEGIARARRELHVEYLFFSGETDAHFVRGQLKTGKDFERSLLDSTLDALRDTATVIWGDADTTIEGAAYRLTTDGLSPVVAAGDGFYILRLLRSAPNSFYTEMPPVTLRERVVARIRMRKEQAREEIFVRELLRNKKAFSPPDLFKRFAAAVDAVFRSAYVPPSTALSATMGGAVLARLAGAEQETLIVAGLRSWTVGETVERLVTRGFAVNGDSVRGVASRLYSVFWEWSRHELLAEEGFSRGLDRSPSVQQRLAPWRDHYLAGMAQQRIREIVRVDDADVYAHMRSTDPTVLPPEVRLRVLRTSGIQEMDGAFRQLEAGVTFDQVIRSFSMDPVDRQNGGLTPFFPVTERYPLGAIAARLEPGQFYGPLRDTTGYIYMQLVERRSHTPPADTAFAARFSRAREEARKLKERRAVTLFVAQSAATRGVDIYQERLSRLHVTPVPMLTYRLLGFGGRMFEVPFVEPQLDWLNVEPPKETILP
jgi:parvulin-like peptidyl-prolyl isomerase